MVRRGKSRPGRPAHPWADRGHFGQCGPRGPLAIAARQPRRRWCDSEERTGFLELRRCSELRQERSKGHQRT